MGKQRIPKSARGFSDALRDAMAVRGVSKAELARRTGRSASAISNYTLDGRDIPPPAVVFAIEDALDLAPGTLSQLLGFCRCDETRRVPGVEEAVIADPVLNPEHKKTLVGFYKGLTVTAVQR